MMGLGVNEGRGGRMKVVLEVEGFRSRGDAFEFMRQLLLFCDKLPPGCSVKVSIIEESKL